MLKVGTRVRIKDNLTEEITGINKTYLEDILGKETVVLDDDKLEIDSRWAWEDDWLEIIEVK